MNNETDNKKGGWSSVSVAGDCRITPFGAKLRHYKLDELPGLWDVLRGKMSFVGPRPDVPGYADKLVGDDRDVLKLRPGITGPATLKYRLEDEYLTNARTLVAKLYDKNQELENSRIVPSGSQSSKSEKNLLKNLPKDWEKMSDQELVVWYNNVIYPNKVRLNCYYYRHYSFINDIQMIICTVLGKKMKYAGEEI
ncbi:MAG: sugar transferase [Bacteroidaceae bacterium]|nr:sugar transferase [Bacteroidaceae bacterium]